MGIYNGNFHAIGVVPKDPKLPERLQRALSDIKPDIITLEQGRAAFEADELYDYYFTNNHNYMIPTEQRNELLHASDADSRYIKLLIALERANNEQMGQEVQVVKNYQSRTSAFSFPIDEYGCGIILANINSGAQENYEMWKARVEESDKTTIEHHLLESINNYREDRFTLQVTVDEKYERYKVAYQEQVDRDHTGFEHLKGQNEYIARHLRAIVRENRRARVVHIAHAYHLVDFKDNFTLGGLMRNDDMQRHLLCKF